MTINQEDPQDPVLAFTVSEKIGRVYRKPDTIIADDLKPNDIRKLILTGVLVPSTTNVISVRNSPFLLPWAARLVANAAVTMANTNPNFFVRAKANPYGAIDYFKETPTRERDFWGNQGSRIHLACELLAKNLPLPEGFDLTDYEKKSINAWKKWLDVFQPEFKYIEATGFGTTKENKLGYAHTTDVVLEINNKTVIGDYKCVTDDTPILMFNGSVKKAIDVVEGDEVVAWDKTGLHTAKVSYAGDNGHHKVAKITTMSGHTVTTTLNHPFWSSRRNQKLTWVKAEDLELGDEVYVAMGWNYSRFRQEEKWAYNKYLSPYLLGILWALRNYKEQDWTSEKYVIEVPPFSRNLLKEELHESAFRFNKAGKMSVVKGLNKIADKNETTVEEILAVIDTPEIPEFVYAGSQNSYYGFFAGIREVFANKELSEEELIVFLNKEATANLQQLYTNFGQPATVTTDPRTGQSYLKTPFDNQGTVESENTIYTHGSTPSRVASIEISEEPQHTVAMEVEGSHTHITGGIITHNTNRTGLHIDVALQLAANARGEFITADNKTLEPMPKIDDAIGIHISPKGVTTNRIDISDNVYDVFQSLRQVWDFQAFEGKTDIVNARKGVILEEIHSPKDI